MNHVHRKLITSALALGAGLFILLTPLSAKAATFTPNRVIDDFVFSNTNTMNAAGIDAFLNSFPNSCISTNKGFSAVDPTGYSPSTGYQFGGNVSAGTIIYHAATAYDVNPQVLLTTLQKEQGLVTGNAGCSTLRYTGATGYGCPDSGTTYTYTNLNLYTINGVTTSSVTGTCVNSPLKAGFSQQVIRAAWLLKFGQQRSLGRVSWAIVRGSWDNSDDPQSCYGGPMTTGTFAVCPSGGSTYYDGYRTIDGSAVHMDTGATASLYWYTPHFHGNQVFFDTFTEWFGLPYANDTEMAHPEGALINQDNNIYLIEGGQKRHVANPSVFSSQGFLWSDVKTATTGDKELPFGSELTDLAPGTIFTMNDGRVWIVDYINGILKKRWISVDSFNALGYRWDEVVYYPAADVSTPSDPGVYVGTKHPAGTLLVSPARDRVFVMEATSLRHVVNPTAYDSWRFSGNKMHPATSADMAMPPGADLDIKPGAIIFADGIYVIDYDQNGIFKRPLGPWECYANRLHYSTSDWVVSSTAFLPTRTGSLFTC